MSDSELQRLIDQTNKGSEKAKDFPHTIIFDWNGTVDARNTGVGIPLKTLKTLISLGKNVVVFTSSADADRKLFMRKICQENNIPYTDNEDILDYADMFVADKDSDERKAGKHGINFVRTWDFDLEKTLPDVKVKIAKGREIHEQKELCTCKHPGPHTEACDCIVSHPVTEKP